MKTYIGTIAILVLAASTAISQMFDWCYSFSGDWNVATTYCRADGCTYALATPNCYWCENSFEYTGKTCYQDESYEATVQSYGGDTQCVNHVCTGGSKVGDPFTKTCYFTSEYSDCAG
jgi:hypothetical protein